MFGVMFKRRIAKKAALIAMVLLVVASVFWPGAVEVASAYEGAGEPCDGVYVFSSALNLRKGLEIRDSECELREIDGSRAQQFRLQRDAYDGCYWIISMRRGKRLGVARF